MAGSRRIKARNRIGVSILVCAIGLIAVVYLSYRVIVDLRLLNTAQSDNVQWTLSQSEVEFLEFDIALFDAQLTSEPDLATLRREFDIFYSRISTLEQASIYAPLRELPVFAENLAVARNFLDDIVPAIDGSDGDLVAELPRIQVKAEAIRPDIRKLSNSALEFFATESDARRTELSSTLIQLAAGIAALLAVLLLLATYLGFLNAQNVRRREQAVEASHRMNVVTGTSLDGVIISDATGKILEFNAAAEQIFEIKAGDAVGRDLGAVIVPDHHIAAHNAGMERMRQNGERRVVGKGRVRLEAKRAGGEIFPVELAIQSADTKNGEIFVAFLRDISHRVKAEDDLKEARDKALAGEKAKTDFLATMSHEIRTPLNGLLGNLTLLQDTRLNAKQSRYISNMQTSGKLLMSHISDVLDITKYDAGKLKLRPVDLNLSALMQDIADNQSSTAATFGTTLEWGWDGPKLEWIRADQERVQHILMNLIGNAVKFTRDGKITVSLRQIDKDLEIAVTDTGIGIPADKQTQIFDDFVTGDSAYNRKTGGTGLGLGIAKRFVSALGGSITLNSEEGRGSTFTVRFPVTAIDPPEETTSRVMPTHGQERRHVLLVEDNLINREVAREMIAADGHQVTEAHDGAEAVRLATLQSFDLILMDISMPVMDGREATRAIRAADGPSSNVPIIALTANAMREEQEAYLQDGMDDVLTKPLSREALLGVLGAYGRNVASSMSAVGSETHLQSLVDTIGQDMTIDLLHRFEGEVDQTLSGLNDWENLAFAEISATAHKTVGSAATLGATALREGLVAVEDAAKAKDTDALAAAVASLPSIWAETKRWLKI